MTLCAFIFFAMEVNAQDHYSQKWYVLAQPGIVFNNSNVHVQPAVAGGWQWKGFGIGLAAGIDFLEITGIQTGLDLRKTFKTGKQQLVAFVNPGLNLVTPTKSEVKEANRIYLSHHFKNGHYLEMGAGIVLGKKKNLLAAFYWSRKTYEETFTDFLWNPVLQKIETLQATNKFESNRPGIRLGFKF
jgi:hypothetical protein